MKDAMVGWLKRMTGLCLFLLFAVCGKAEVVDTLRTATRLFVEVTYTTQFSSDGKCTLTINKVRKWKGEGCHFLGNMDDLVVMFFDKQVPNNDYGDIIIHKDSPVKLRTIYLEGYHPSKRGYFILTNNDHNIMVGTFNSSATVVQIPFFLATLEKNKKRWPWQKRGASVYTLFDDCGLLNVKVAPQIKKETLRYTTQGKDTVNSYVEVYEDSIVEEKKEITPDNPYNPSDIPQVDMGGVSTDTKARRKLNRALRMLNCQSSSLFEPGLDQLIKELDGLQDEVTDESLSNDIGEFLKTAIERKEKLQIAEVEQTCGRFLTALENCDNSDDLAFLNHDKAEIEKMLDMVTDPSLTSLKEKLKDTLRKHQEKEKECNDKETRNNWILGILIFIVVTILLFFGGILKSWIYSRIFIPPISLDPNPSIPLDPNPSIPVTRLTYPSKYRLWQWLKKWFSRAKDKLSNSGPKSPQNQKTGYTVKDVNGNVYQVKKGKKKQKQNDKK